MENSAHERSLVWAHLGDLHITAAQEPNYRDFLSIIDTVNTQLAEHIDFCALPGDNADDGSLDQYALIRRGLERLKLPVHVIPGDHDRKPGDLQAFYQGLGLARLPRTLTVGRCRCLFLDVVSRGRGGPDFAIGGEQLEWLEAELKSAAACEQDSVVFMHAYPADLKRDGYSVRRLLKDYRVALVDMGHTHYNELANDGTTIFATTRSTGQIEEGPVGFSLVSLQQGVVSWRFKPLRTSWPFVMITSPSDHRLVTDLTCPAHIVSGEFTVAARVFGAHESTCRHRVNDGPWKPMHRAKHSAQWEGRALAPADPFTLSVEATDLTGHTDTDKICVATPGFRPPDRAADGSDADALDPWPERHLLGTRLGPNRNGRQW